MYGAVKLDVVTLHYAILSSLEGLI